MPDFFSRLLDRARGVAPVIQPDLPPALLLGSTLPLEPAAPLDAPPEISAPPMTRRPRTAAPLEHLTADEGLEDTEPSETLPANPVASAPLPPATASEGQRDLLPPEQRRQEIVERTLQEFRQVTEEREIRLHYEADEPPDAPEIPVVQRFPDNERAPSAPMSEARPPERMIYPAARTAAPPAAPTQQQASRISLEADDMPETNQPPTVQVYIGRIDVRAINAPPPQLKAAPPPKGPTVTLDDYLNDGRKGKR